MITLQLQYYNKIHKYFAIIILLFFIIPAYGQTQTNEVDIMGTPPGVALIGDGNISASFSKEGKMVTFFYPHVGAYDFIPYFTKPTEEKYYGAPEHLGAFLGITEFHDNQDQFTIKWLHAYDGIIKHDWNFPAFNF
jgi:hypothetical protein